jgi:polysaccharide export outer membrane protein
MKIDVKLSIKPMIGKIISFLSLIILLHSCGINSSIMFKSPKGEHVLLDTIPMYPKTDYRISIEDRLTFTLSTNEGSQLINQISGINAGANGMQSAGNAMDFVVRKNGKVELPVLGYVQAEGFTVEQFEDTLQALFSSSFQDPFVQVKITNKRVVIFPGEAGKASVVPLINENTTLMEALAQSGGITERGKANSIKIMRRENGIRRVYTIDLSTIEGLKYADLVLQANDYIYIEPVPQLAREIVKEIAPVISIFSSALVIFTVISNLK